MTVTDLDLRVTVSINFGFQSPRTIAPSGIPEADPDPVPRYCHGHV